MIDQKNYYELEVICDPIHLTTTLNFIYELQMICDPFSWVKINVNKNLVWLFFYLLDIGVNLLNGQKLTKYSLRPFFKCPAS